MNTRSLVLALCLSAASAFRAGAPVSGVKMSAEQSVSRRQMGSALLTTIAGAGFAGAASATAGDSPKFSFFGMGTGEGPTQSEGGDYSIDAGKKTFSSYSVFGDWASEDAAYNQKWAVGVEPTRKAAFVESAKRVAKTKAYVDTKSWEDVRAELIRQAYTMRSNMNYLAKGDSAKEAAAKNFYQNLEELNLSSKRKNQEDAYKAYDKTMGALDAFAKLL